MPTTDGTSDTPHIYVSAYALCVRDRQMLLARIAPGRYDTGQWALPGGGLNWGEAPEDAVLRELTEETGLIGRAPRLAAIFSATYARTPERPLDPLHHIGIAYFVETLPGELRDERDGSTDHCAWFPLADLDAVPLVVMARLGREFVTRHLAAEPT
ncbi:MAG TPA: NUDIX domain-containing protein [Chloroflexota bacterium]|nr:NUDIX domain-containing protein [Chloroflexota bacterium]